MVTTQLQMRTEEQTRADTIHRQQLQDKTDTISCLQDDLTRLRTQAEWEREGTRRKVEGLQGSLDQSEAVRQSLLTQVERNGQELEKMTDRLATVRGREGEAERCRAETEQLRIMVRSYCHPVLMVLVAIVGARGSSWERGEGEGG